MRVQENNNGDVFVCVSRVVTEYPVMFAYRNMRKMEVSHWLTFSAHLLSRHRNVFNILN